MSMLAESAARATLRTPLAVRSKRLPVGSLAAAAAWLIVALLVVVPLAALALRASSATFAEATALLVQPRVLSAFRTTFATSIVAATVDVALALPVAWCLGRYEFPGRRLIDALVDMPLALPTSVAGLTLAALTSEGGPLGPFLAALGLRIAYTPVGITLALAFVGFPFVVRALEPVVHVLDEGSIEAAHSLGARPPAILLRVVVPQLVPAALTGFTVALARSLGEYGSIVFIAGNLPFKTELVSYFIVARLEDHEPLAATVLAVALLALSGTLLALVSVLERRASDSLVPAERV